MITIAVDFDGTMVEHKYPDVGQPVPGAVNILLEAIKRGARIILWTMRSGPELLDAVQYMERAGIPLFGINTCPGQESWTASPKACADLYIDDAAVGTPLRESFMANRPMVDWYKLEPMLWERMAQ